MKIVLTPDWFLGKDVIIDIFSFLILTVFFILCWRYYKLSKKKSLAYLGGGFGLIALAQLAMIVTKLVLYYDTTFIQQMGQAIITYHFFKSVDTLYYVGFFLNKFLTLIGLYIIYRLPEKKKIFEDFLLIFYFLLVSALFGTNIGLVFHSSVIILLIMIINNYYDIYEKNKSTNTKMLLIAFGVLTLGHLLYAFADLLKNYIVSACNEYLAVIGNITELISFMILLVLIIRLLKHGQKKKPYGYNT